MILRIQLSIKHLLMQTQNQQGNQDYIDALKSANTANVRLSAADVFWKQKP